MIGGEESSNDEWPKLATHDRAHLGAPSVGHREDLVRGEDVVIAYASLSPNTSRQLSAWRSSMIPTWNPFEPCEVPQAQPDRPPFCLMDATDAFSSFTYCLTALRSSPLAYIYPSQCFSSSSITAPPGDSQVIHPSLKSCFIIRMQDRSLITFSPVFRS